MSDGQGQDPYKTGQPDQKNTEDILEQRIEEIKRLVIQGTSEAQIRLKRVVDKANIYWQQTQAQPTPEAQQATSVEEQRIRQLANLWSNENWRVARDLDTYMDVVSWGSGEVWMATLETRWETRKMEVVTEPYTGQVIGIPQPLLPVWDYELPPVVGLKAPQTRTRLGKMDEFVACTVCNGTGHVLCSNCNGRGWIVCPDCKGRTKRRCATCRGRGYVADWSQGEKKPFLQRQAENVANSVGDKVADVFDTVRQKGVPIPNPIDIDPASKGPTMPCPDCIKGEAGCTCGNGKRVCNLCEGARMSLCSHCSGSGKLVRHREILRRFDQRSHTRIIGDCPIPEQHLLKANGEMVYNAEVNEALHPEAPPDAVPIDVWRLTVQLVQDETQNVEKPGVDPQASSRPTLQVLELIRVPYTTVQYYYADQEYLLYVFDSEGKEKFYADHYPARWTSVERLVKAITADLVAPVQKGETTTNPTDNHRAPVEFPSYNITEEGDDGDSPDKYRYKP